MRTGNLIWWSGLALLAWSALPARAELSAWEVLNRALAVTEQVQDYTANCTFSAELPGQDTLTRQFGVYFKRPDQLRVDSDSVVLVPREALTFGDLRRHLNQDMDASLAGVGSLGEEAVYSIKLKPRDENRPDRLLVWIRSGNWTPTRTEIWRGETQMVQLWWSFALIADQYWMPTGLTAHVPSGILSPEGPVTVRLGWQDYQVNTGLSDDLFTSQQ